MKILKLWNGRGCGKYEGQHFYIAAYSTKQATEILSKASETKVSAHEINVYYSKGCWGNTMNGIIATEPCVYVSKEDKKPIKIY